MHKKTWVKRLRRRGQLASLMREYKICPARVIEANARINPDTGVTLDEVRNLKNNAALSLQKVQAIGPVIESMLRAAGWRGTWRGVFVTKSSRERLSDNLI